MGIGIVHLPHHSNDCKVPVENCWRDRPGSSDCFNILNIGRFKLGAMCVGGDECRWKAPSAMPSSEGFRQGD